MQSRDEFNLYQSAASAFRATSCSNTRTTDSRAAENAADTLTRVINPAIISAYKQCLTSFTYGIRVKTTFGNDFDSITASSASLDLRYAPPQDLPSVTRVQINDVRIAPAGTAVCSISGPGIKDPKRLRNVQLSPGVTYTIFCDKEGARKSSISTTVYTSMSVGGTYQFKLNNETPSSAVDALVARINSLDQQVAAQARQQAALQQALTQATQANALARGSIIMWSGSNPPAGWLLCDGTNGTPDLRNRFVVGAGGKYPTNSVGGQEVSPTETDFAGVHAHGGATGPFTLTVAHIPPHTHTVQMWGGEQSRPVYEHPAHTMYDTPANMVTTGATGGGQAHDHGIGGDGAHKHYAWVTVIPPYYALAYIMKA
eukprot:gene7740-7939_t